MGEFSGRPKDKAVDMVDAITKVEEVKIDEASPVQIMNKAFKDLDAAVKKAYPTDKKKVEKSLKAIMNLKDKIINR